jgi:hypothetical protein
VETKSDVPGIPLRAVSLMKQIGLHGNLVTDYGWAQYVLWQLHPSTKVAFDGRYRTVYPARLEREFVAFYRTSHEKPNRTPILDDYETEIALLPTGRGPCEYLDSRSDWVCILADQQASLYVRDIPKFQETIARSRSGRIRFPSVPTWQRFPAEPTVLPSVNTSRPAPGGKEVVTNRAQAV